MLNGLDPYHDRHYVVPDLGLHCLQKLSADTYKERIKFENKLLNYSHVKGVNDIFFQ